jgi:hypothetical protein
MEDQYPDSNMEDKYPDSNCVVHEDDVDWGG